MKEPQTQEQIQQQDAEVMLEVGHLLEVFVRIPKRLRVQTATRFTRLLDAAGIQPVEAGQ